MQGVRPEEAGARAWVVMNEPRAGREERNGEGGLAGTGEKERGSWEAGSGSRSRGLRPQGRTLSWAGS